MKSNIKNIVQRVELLQTANKNEKLAIESSIA